MRLYYMTAQHWGLVILRESRLKISTIRELNDPFELLGASVGAKDMRRIMKALHGHWSRTLGMICLTDNWKSPVMWAHYAEKHHGFCLGFDVTDRPEIISKVNYVPDRLYRALRHDKRQLRIDEALLVKVLTTKYHDWSYENEYRLFADLNDRDRNGLYYLNFGPDIVLREVILGARCKLTPKTVASEITNPARPIRVFKARPAFNSFSIVRQNRVGAVTIKVRRSPQR